MVKIVALMLVALSVRVAHAETSMKGWEIYSWFDMTCSAKPQLHSAPNADSVCFALLPGTNREKTTEEIKKAAMPIAALEKAIAKLKRGEEVSWSGREGVFDLPEEARGNADPRNRAVAALKKQGVKLSVARRYR